MNGGISEKELPEQFDTDEYQVLHRGREVPDRLRPAAPAHDVRGQEARGRAGRADALAPQPHLPRQEDTFVLDFVQRARRDPGVVQAVLRADGGRRAAEARTALRSAGEAGRDNTCITARGGGVLQGVLQAEGEVRAHRPCPDEHDPRPGRGPVQARCGTNCGPSWRRRSGRRRRKRPRRSSGGCWQPIRNLYGFLSQVIPYQDSDLEKLYAYGRFLLSKLPRRSLGPQYHFDDEVALKFYRLEKLSDGAIDLKPARAAKSRAQRPWARARARTSRSSCPS